MYCFPVAFQTNRIKFSGETAASFRIVLTFNIDKMTTKQNFSGNRKSGEITTRSDKSYATQQVETILKNIKQKAGEVVLIQITDRTSIELPAHLSQEERDARVANYIKLHKPGI